MFAQAALFAIRALILLALCVVYDQRLGFSQMVEGLLAPTLSGVSLWPTFVSSL